jgi:octaprenyl-diphosphate synthase
VGDILYSQFFSITTGLQSVPQDQRLRLLDEFSDVTKKMCLGEMYEHYIKTNAIEPSFEDYLSVIESKTASLLSMCCFTGALLNGADEKLIRMMAGFGLNLGMAFQIVDDYLDNDSVFKEKSVLLEKATEYMSLAEEKVVSLQRNSISVCLQKISNYIISRAL